MVDVLLAHSFFMKNDEKQVAKMRPYPPLGTLYLASCLRRRGYAVALFDAMLSHGIHEFEAALGEAAPRFVLLAEDQFNFLNKMCLKHSRDAAFHMAALARAAGAVVIAAGSDLSDHPRRYLENGVHYGVVGEPEHTAVELIDALSGQAPRDLDDIDGLVRAAPGSPLAVRRNRPRAPERHPDVFPFPAWDLIDPEPYRRSWKTAHGYFSVNMVSTRGCPFHCNWCAKPIWGQRYAMRSPDDVAEEMALVKSLLAPDHIWFADDIFGLRPEWVVAFADRVAARGADIPFTIQSRVDLMTEQAVAAFARAGCKEIWLGAESGSQKILDAMDKGTRVDEIRVVRERLRGAGIRVGFFLQFGYPGETWQDIQATIALVRECLPDDIGVSVSYPLPGTKFYRMVERELGKKDHWRDSNDLEMMFQGRYRTAFYRKLHALVHEELELHKLLARPDGDRAALRERAEALAALWFELGRLEVTEAAAHPTRIEKDSLALIPPDLSRNYN